jgi:hypothetical protein
VVYKIYSIATNFKKLFSGRKKGFFGESEWLNYLTAQLYQAQAAAWE